MTVSRVLNNATTVSPTTRRRVLDIADEMGYSPDPIMKQLMVRVRRQRHRGERATLVLLQDGEFGELWEHHYVGIESIRARAGIHGYKVEAMLVGNGGLAPKRVNSILKARGTQGVLISVSSPHSPCEHLDFDRIAAVTFGYGLARPSLHRISSNLTQGLLDAFENLESQGSERIGLAITPWIDLRAGHCYSGALLHYQQSIPSGRRLPIHWLSQRTETAGRRAFQKWVRDFRPDAIISFLQPIQVWLQAMRKHASKNICLMVHDWQPSMISFPGINHRRDEVAAAAVDLLATHIQQNEFGVPEVPRQVLIPTSLYQCLS